VFQTAHLRQELLRQDADVRAGESGGREDVVIWPSATMAVDTSWRMAASGCSGVLRSLAYAFDRADCTA
jgi:hypothetical protein